MLANKLMSALSGAEDKLYVDSVFSTYLYTGNSSAQTINNGIDLAGKGGLVWQKSRSAVLDHLLFDTARGAGYYLASNTTAAQAGPIANPALTFQSNGFTPNAVANGTTLATWTFRKASKFFDVVTYTGDGVTNRQIPHNLGAYPGCIIVKRTDMASNWKTYHVTSWSGSTPVTFTNMQLNTTDAGTTEFTGINTNGRIVGNGTTDITLQAGSASISDVNATGGSYVAYLFAHDPSADGIIQCGSFTTDASGNATVNLGWEPQFVMWKRSDGVLDWNLFDSTRGFPVGGGQRLLRPNIAATEVDLGTTDYLSPTATGFKTANNYSGAGIVSYIYLAIRRPNKPPTTGTEVYNAIARTGTGAAATVTGVGFAPDLLLSACRNTTFNNGAYSRLTGANLLIPNLSAAEVGGASSGVTEFTQNGASLNSDPNNGTINYAGFGYINHFFRRAPGFFDVVCYTGTEVARTVPHSLGVAPELMIVKRRDGVGAWFVGFEFTTSNMSRAYLDQTNGKVNATYAAFGAGAISGQPTGVSFPLAAGVGELNTSSNTVVAYLFASLPGVSKVGAYTGNGTTQTINCGFTTGARFILIKKTSGTGDWLVADTARGIVSAGDPRLSLNTTAAEVTGEDWLDPDATGFIINQTTADANASGASYIFLAIA